MKRLLVASVVVLALMAAFAPATFGSIFWCEDDPLVKIKTPQGSVVNVHVTNYGEGAENLRYVQNAKIDWVATPTRDGRGTRVEITVLVPNNPETGEPFRVRSVASSLESGEGVVWDKERGWSGEPLKLSFRLNVP